MLDRLKEICFESLKTKNLGQKESRLKDELREIEIQNEAGYFLSLYDQNVKFPNNENNLLVAYLLDICPHVNLEVEPSYIYGDFPDIDVDFLPAIRSYLKDEFTRQTYGDDCICNIATYNTFGLRSSLIDMARVLGLDRGEVIKITTSLGIKDDEGEILTWDKAVELYDELRKYLEEHPDLADAAKRLLNRNRSLGQHASGVIISGTRIKDFCPLVMPRGASVPAAAWVEGLHGTDLGAVGLVKFDFLSLDGNYKIALAAKHAIDAEEGAKASNMATDLVGGRICALPGMRSWSNTSYLNDPEALKMANRGDLKMIFQYDGSEGIRRLAKEGGVENFDDFATYTALYRPGPMKRFKTMVNGREKTLPSMAEQFIARKQGKEEFDIHPLLEPFMRSTYNILVYQEQVMRMLNVVGKIPLRDCEAVRKAISKKQVDKFLKYKEMFVTNGQETLGKNKDELNNLFEQIEAFAGYGFNLSHTVAYSYISSRMLYLKCHYPKEFYASVLSCTKAAGPKDYRRLKDYKQESEKHGVTVEKVDLNRSGFDCNIIDGKIFYGVSKIKGIGDETAQRIVELAPYTGFMDFITRFGTDAKVVQALIALRQFNEADPLTLYKFYEAYKNYEKKRVDREKRHDLKVRKLQAELERSSHPEKIGHLNKKITECRVAHANKVSSPPTLESFDRDAEVEVGEDLLSALKDSDLAEMEFYGFIWSHPLEKCPDYHHYTIEKFHLEGLEEGPIEVMIDEVEERQGKKVSYYQINTTDACGDEAKITVWKQDFEALSGKLRVGEMVRLRCKAPQPPFRNFTMLSNSKPWQKAKVNQLDSRVVTLARG